MSVQRTAVMAMAIMAAALVLAACQPQKPPVAPAPSTAPVAPPDMKWDVTRGVTQARADLALFQRRANEPLPGDTSPDHLPGHTSADHRRMMVETFTDLLTLLRDVHGPIVGGAFKDSLGEVRTARDRLAQLDPDASAAPIIATGLRATYDVLQTCYTEQFADDTALGDALKALLAKLNEFDVTRGPMTEQVAAEATRQIGRILQQMNDDLAARAGMTTSRPAAPPATLPTMPPATLPAMPPATLPAMPPATLPASQPS